MKIFSKKGIITSELIVRVLIAVALLIVAGLLYLAFGGKVPGLSKSILNIV